MWVYEDFNFLQQLIVPGFTGAIGGLAVVVMASLNDDKGLLKFKSIYTVYIKFALLGIIAGIAAVNLLNPQGNISQVLVLGLIAGLSGVSYLKRTALVDDIHEKLALDIISKNIEDKAKNSGIADLVDLVAEKGKVLFEAELEEMDEDYELQVYINDKIDEWVMENPDASNEEYDDQILKLLEDVSENPDLIKLHKQTE